MLAGTSISMISGQDGIINKAIKSKDATLKAQGEERLNLLMTEYQLKEYTEDINLKNYLLENLSNAVINEDKNTGCLKIDYNNEIYILNSDGNINKVEQDTNLVKNGFLTYKDNTNFKDWTYNNVGFLTNIALGRKMLYTSDFIEVDTSKKYYQSITIRSNNSNANCYIGFAQYDVDKKTIEAKNSTFVKDTLTYLERDINDGDTVIYLHDVSKFQNNPSEALVLSMSGLIFWNYKDSTGFEYPELTYSRNVYTDLFEYDKIDYENNIITLKNAWNKGKIEAGTKLSQSSSGDGHNWGLWSSSAIPNEWINRYNIITGEINDGNIDNKKKFRSGTKYIKPVFLINHNEVESSVTTDIKDIIFQEIK